MPFNFSFVALYASLHETDQKRFTISEVAADWHELMIPQHIMPVYS